MIWLLVLVALILIGLGVWGGPGFERGSAALHRRMSSERPGGGDDAWAIITTPLDRGEAIYIPEHRPWYLPGADRRFQRGLMVGLGTGILLAAAAVSLSPRSAETQPPVAQTPVPTPAPTEPAPVAPPAAQPPAAAPRPANVTFVVEPGSDPTTIAGALRTAGLIADEQAFVSRVTELGMDTRLKAGTFIIPTGASLDEVIGVLTA